MMEKWIVEAAVVVVAGIIGYKIAEYLDKKKSVGEPVESIYVDELGMGEIKAWFSIVAEHIKGIVLMPTKDNLNKWNIKMPEREHVLIQLVYDEKKEKVLSYREIGYSEMSEKLQALMESSDGTIVIEK